MADHPKAPKVNNVENAVGNNDDDPPISLKMWLFWSPPKQAAFHSAAFDRFATVYPKEQFNPIQFEDTCFDQAE